MDNKTKLAYLRKFVFIVGIISILSILIPNIIERTIMGKKSLYIGLYLPEPLVFAYLLMMIAWILSINVLILDIANAVKYRTQEYILLMLFSWGQFIVLLISYILFTSLKGCGCG